jgi:hypothetical protein
MAKTVERTRSGRVAAAGGEEGRARAAGAVIGIPPQREPGAGDRALAAATQLQKIGFVEFTTRLITDVYNAIVKASIDQLKAYADYVNTISKTLEDYQNELTGSDPVEQKARADDRIQNVYHLPLTPDPISLNNDQVKSLQQEFVGVTARDAEDTQDMTIDDAIKGTDTGSPHIALADLEALVIAERRLNAAEAYDLLKTVLQMGMQKVVVTNGDILTKLVFHVDSTDNFSATTMNIRERGTSLGIQGALSGRYGGTAETQKDHKGEMANTALGGMIGGGISGNYASNKLNVSVVNESHTAATNVTVDIIGQVKIQFRTETLPIVAG